MNEKSIALNHLWGSEILKYFNDDNVTEIMLNTNKTLFIDTFSHGMIKTDIVMSADTVISIAHILAAYVGQEINNDNPSLCGELPISGHRFQIDIPPIVDFPTFNFRKKASKIFSLDDYLKNEIISENQYNVILQSINEKKNILIVGGTGSGKTTLINAILNETKNSKDRILVLEDTQELQCAAENQVFYKTSKTVSMKTLIQITMRKTPTRIIVGEIREGEAALSLLKAWNSGHSGGISTIHADTALLGIKKLEQYIEEVSINSQSKLISSVVNIVIVIRKIGLKRKVTEILKINDYKNNEYQFIREA